MTKPHSRLVRHLALVVLIKLALLMLLWWLFIRDAKVAVDIETTATHLAAPVSAGAAIQETTR